MLPYRAPCAPLRSVPAGAVPNGLHGALHRNIDSRIIVFSPDQQPGTDSRPPLDNKDATVKRRLAAILAADGAHFSRLVAQDEERTLKLLAEHRAVLDGAIHAFGGRIVTTAGDSVLAEFSSPVNALRAAMDAQQALARRNAERSLAQPLLFRMGINVGDVVVEGEDILGDDVNVAVRLENLAPPGGICIAASVREHVAGKVDVRLQDLGMQFLKNIPRPVRVYQVLPAPSGPGPAMQTHTRLELALVAAAVVGLVGSAAWFSADQATPPQLAHAERNAQSPAVPSHERAYWDSVRQSSDPAELRAYLHSYPAGTFRELAQARLDGLLAAEQRRGEEEEAGAKAAEALRAQTEALRLRAQAEAAIARAAQEQATAARLKEEAEAAADRAASAARAAADAQQRKLRPAQGQAERVVLLRSASAFDGPWNSEWTCEASAEQPAATLRLPAKILHREIHIEVGQSGLPGYFRAYGTVSDEGSFVLQGTHLARSRRIVGNEDRLQASGRLEGDNLEGSGSIGKRRCSVAFARAPAS